MQDFFARNRQHARKDAFLEKNKTLSETNRLIQGTIHVNESECTANRMCNICKCTFRPVPKTIASYSSSMVVQWWQRAGEEERKGEWSRETIREAQLTSDSADKWRQQKADSSRSAERVTTWQRWRLGAYTTHCASLTHSTRHCRRRSLQLGTGYSNWRLYCRRRPTKCPAPITLTMLY